MSEMHEATPVSQPFPHFERLVDSREAAALLRIPPENTSTTRPKGRDTRHADRSSASEWARSVAPTGEYENLVTRLDCAA
jgi:hypothetical protein